ELTNTSAQVYNLSTSALINADKIKGQLYARPRREGDRILIRGMHRSVKKLICEKASHVELSKRRSLPVICCGEEIVWVPFLDVADGYKGGILTINYCID
ncbi:MAG: tRNA lysidine(34) synthetase TilS, partial [Clostridia bacterium]|nr:tRNA lysidine(34) synthetase TilS [Clostridia bacterium]